MPEVIASHLARSLEVAVHLLLMLVLPPLLPGIINKVKASFGGRVGPPLFQLYYDLFRLLRKGVVRSSASSWVFFAGPVAVFSTALVAALLMPLGAHPAPLSFAGDLVLVAYLFGLARFATISAALDTGSPFEGMGAAREASFATLAEPALFLGFATLALIGRGHPLSLSELLPVTAGSWYLHGGALALTFAAWFIVLLVENCRIPFDDPNTHLELTMIHEVMILDHSGPPLALILYGASLKFFVLAALLIGLALPATGDALQDWATFLGALILVTVAVGLVESLMARLRLPRVPLLLVAATLAAGFGFLHVLLGR